MVVVFFIVEVGSYAFKVQGEITKLTNLATGRGTEGEDKGMLDGVVKVPAAIQKQLDNIRDFLQTTELVTKQIPMLAILIVFARLRAKVDLEGTDPPQYAQNAFITIGILVAVQAGALFLDTCENATFEETQSHRPRVVQVVDHGLRRNCDRIDFLGEKGSGKDQTIILKNQSYKDIKHLEFRNPWNSIRRIMVSCH